MLHIFSAFQREREFDAQDRKQESASAERREDPSRSPDDCAGAHDFAEGSACATKFPFQQSARISEELSLGHHDPRLADLWPRRPGDAPATAWPLGATSSPSAGDLQ